MNTLARIFFTVVAATFAFATFSVAPATGGTIPVTYRADATSNFREDAVLDTSQVTAPPPRTTMACWWFVGDADFWTCYYIEDAPKEYTLESAIFIGSKEKLVREHREHLTLPSI